VVAERRAVVAELISEMVVATGSLSPEHEAARMLIAAAKTSAFFTLGSNA